MNDKPIISLRKISLLVALCVQLVCVEFAGAAPFISEAERPELVKNPLGERRVLAVCLPETHDMTTEKLNTFYSTIDWKEFDERHLMVVELRENTRFVQNIDYAENTITRNRVMSGFRKTKIRDVTRCTEDVEFVLIGKDSTAKKRWNSFMPLDDIYATIDAMPMRRFEMKYKMEKN